MIAYFILVYLHSLTTAVFILCAHRKLQEAHKAGLPDRVRVLTHNDSLGEQTQLAERLIKYIDHATELAQPSAAARAQGTTTRPRGLTVAEARRAERGAGVRGGLMALFHAHDPFFTFRLTTSLIMITALWQFVIDATPFGSNESSVDNFCEIRGY